MTSSSALEKYGNEQSYKADKLQMTALLSNKEETILSFVSQD